jgi:epoxyqueuosine reductase
MKRGRDFQKIKTFFDRKLAEIGYYGVFGVAEFKKVYDTLMSVQKVRLENICGEQFRDLIMNGSFVCIGIAFPEYAIDSIDVRLCDGSIDRHKWNIYADEYNKINGFLDAIAGEIADSFGGIPIQATVEGISVKNVEEYYGMTVSHRVIAENAGLGWRGKNGLVVNEKFSCAIRFASVITDLPLIHGRKVKASCGECEACLKSCSFLKNKDKLEDYRENCRRYILKLGLRSEVCGKCIKACYRNSIFHERFKLK